MLFNLLNTHVHVSTLIGDSETIDKLYLSCSIMFIRHQIWADLVILYIVDFDIIVGLSWLSPYYVILDYHAKTKIVPMLGMARMEWKGDYIPITMKIISFIRLKRLIVKDVWRS